MVQCSVLYPEVCSVLCPEVQGAVSRYVQGATVIEIHLAQGARSL